MCSQILWMVRSGTWVVSNLHYLHSFRSLGCLRRLPGKRPSESAPVAKEPANLKRSLELLMKEAQVPGDLSSFPLEEVGVSKGKIDSRNGFVRGLMLNFLGAPSEMITGEAHCVSILGPQPAHCNTSPTISQRSRSTGARPRDSGQEPIARDDAAGRN